MKQSRFISLSPYCLAEYIFEPLGSLNYVTDDFILLENKHLNIHQIFNDDGSFSTTKNIKDLTVTPIGQNKYVYLDSEKYPNYISYDPKLIQTQITGYNVVLDQVRFHFIAGFGFDEFEALVLGVRHLENDNKINIFSNILVAPETISDLIIFNPRPIFLSNAQYDRYIDVFIPSIKNINEEYKTALVQSSTFVAAITPNDTSYTGFIYNNPITITLDECGKRAKIYTNINVVYDEFEVTEHFEATIAQTNEFDSVGAYIGESSDGDFIEFYLTFNSGFPEELMSILNKRNPHDNWMIIHQLNIFEQVGTAFINTSKQVFFQEENYDEPNVFRPILKYAHEAVSMTIDYLVRLINKKNGEQIIREASFTLISPKKYGKKLLNIPLLDKPQSQKIYNKLIKKDFEASKLFLERTLFNENEDFLQIQNNNVKTIIKTEYIPIFFSNNNISVSNKSALIKNSNNLEEVIFGQGKLRFILSPFDNLIKLKVYTTSNDSYVPLDLNLNSSKYRLVFDTDFGKISIDNVNNSFQENLSNGEITFRISKKDSESILKSKRKIVYLTVVSQDGTETLIYTGEWRSPEQQSDVDQAINNARQENEQKNSIDSKLKDISNKIQKNINELDKQSFDKIPKVSKIKEKASAPIVNKFGVKNPSKIKTNKDNVKKL